MNVEIKRVGGIIAQGFDGFLNCIIVQLVTQNLGKIFHRFFKIVRASHRIEFDKRGDCGIEIVLPFGEVLREKCFIICQIGMKGFEIQAGGDSGVAAGEELLAEIGQFGGLTSHSVAFAEHLPHFIGDVSLCDFFKERHGFGDDTEAEEIFRLDRFPEDGIYLACLLHARLAVCQIV